MAITDVLHQRWLRINAELKRMGCPFEIPKIRQFQDGAHEIIGIKSVYLESRPFFHVVTFDILEPFTGQPGQFSVKLSSGILLIPVIDSKIILVEQFRLTKGTWPWELPRMFLESHSPEKVGLNAVDLIFKNEVEEALDSEPQISTVDLVHSGIYEDSGMSMLSYPVYLVKIRNAKLKDLSKKDWRKKGVRFCWKAFDLMEIRKAMLPSVSGTGLRINDSHTMSAIMALQNKIDLEGYSLS